MAVKRNWRGLLSVALLAGGVLAYKLKASRKGVVSGVEESTAEYPLVLLVAEILEAAASYGCGEIIRCM
jgi:hypothetical protein